MTITAGIDIGTGAVKTVLFRVEGDKTEWLAKRNDRIRLVDVCRVCKMTGIH